MYADRVSAGRKRSVMDRLGDGGARARPDAGKRLCLADGTWRRELYRDSGGAQSSQAGFSSRNIQALQITGSQQSTQMVKKSSVPDLRDRLSGVQQPQLNSTVQVPKIVSENARSAKPVQTRTPVHEEAGLASRKIRACQITDSQQSNQMVKKSSVLDLRDKLSGVQQPRLDSTVKVSKLASGIFDSDKPLQTRGPAALPVTKKIDAPSASAKQSREEADFSVDGLLKSLDLQKYLITFQAEEIDMKALVHMTEEDLKSLGIPMGPRKKILSALASKKKKRSRSLPSS